ncbi:MAG: hypothetical protein ACXAEX_03850 [Promethearchaeota archaeon]|jgi:hypothetical protein
MLNLKKRRKKWFYPKVEVADLKRRLHFLEFENEFILKFLRKYLIINRKENRNSNILDIVEDHDISIFLYNQFNGNHTKMLE